MSEEYITCEYCNKKLKKNYNKKEHEATNDCKKTQGLIVINYKCNTCNSTFGNQRVFNTHVNKCTNTNKINGFIYKIEPIVEHDKNEVYYGSTTYNTLKQRYDHHIKQYKLYVNKELCRMPCSSIKLFEKYGIKNCDIFEIEKINDTIFNIQQREQYYYDNNPNINKKNPSRTLKEDNDYYKKYRDTHKEEIKERDAKYYNENKEKILQQEKEKRDNMTAEEREQYLQHRKETRNAEQEKTTKSKIEICKYCSKEVRHDHMNDHYKSNDCLTKRGESTVIYQCETCKIKCKSLSMLKKHKPNCGKEDIEECEYCKEMIKIIIKNNHHKTKECIKHQPDDIKKLNEENKIICKFCKETIYNKDLGNHLKTKKCREKQLNNDVEHNYCKKKS